MPNGKSETNKHNQNILKPIQRHPDIQLCNCTNKKQCPLKDQCLTESIVYQVDITANIPGYKEIFYLNASKTIFKVCHGNHKKRLQNNVMKTTWNYPRSVER